MLHLPDVRAGLDIRRVFPMEVPAGEAQMRQVLILPLQIPLQFPQTGRVFNPKLGFWQSGEDPGSVPERRKEGSVWDEQGKWGICGIPTVFDWSRSRGGIKLL